MFLIVVYILLITEKGFELIQQAKILRDLEPVNKALC